MNFLLLIVLIMTFTVETKNSVTTEGTWPYDMEANYSCSYQKGTVRANDEAVLTLSHLDGISIEAIDVYVRSNRDAGAGTFTVSAEGQNVSSMSGSLKEWVGQYDNVNYHAISLLSSPVKSVNDLSVRLTGAENSLYIEKYEITWASAAARTVTLMNGNAVYDVLTEISGSQGVILPKVDDLEDWRFVGWTDVPFYEKKEDLPTVVTAGKFVPKEDCTLWAVYEYIVQLEDMIATELEDGDYLYVNWESKMAMCEGVINGEAGTQVIRINAENQIYNVSFNADSTATIRIDYGYGEEYIGFKDKQLVNAPSKWKVYHNGEKTAFYTELKGKTYMLFPGILGGGGHEEYYWCTQLVEVSDVSKAPTVLLHSGKSLQLSWTCYPNAQAIDLTPVNGRAYSIPFGIYELRIENGQKQLQLR